MTTADVSIKKNSIILKDKTTNKKLLINITASEKFTITTAKQQYEHNKKYFPYANRVNIKMTVPANSKNFIITEYRDPKTKQSKFYRKKLWLKEW